MATLKLTISGVTGTRTIDDAKATALANILFDALVATTWPAGVPLPTTPQDRLQAVADAIAIELRDTAREWKRRRLQESHIAADIAELAAIDV